MVAIACCKHALAKINAPVCLECYKELQFVLAQAREERDEAARLMQDACDERDILKEALEKYGEHGRECILARFEAGEPTPDGKYRWKYGGQWYAKLPKCQCGLTAVLGGTDG